MKPETESTDLSPPSAAVVTAAVVTAADDDDDFEFPLVSRDNDSGVQVITDDGRIRLVYPLFDRDLLLRGGGGDDAVLDLEVEELEVYPRSGSVSSTSSVDDAEGTRSVPASPAWCKKSSSTGSPSSRRFRLRDLVIGRSHSDGKDRFVFLAPAAGKKSAATTSEAQPAAKGSKGKVTEMDMATAHRLYYRKGGAAGGSGGAGRRSFLPYKQGLVGFLGLSRTHRF